MEENESKVYSKVPAKISPWTNVKSFFLQPITLELTPYESKVFKEVKDFWNQEIYFDKGFHLRKQQVDAEPIINKEPEVTVNL